MCGLVAAVTTDPRAGSGVRRAMARMERRGPDGEGFWTGPGICLGHRRLAVLDLDERASQPMHSRDGRYSIVFNGEIYNFRELRRKLAAGGAVFQTSSDTEVLLELFARDGREMLPKLRGMFAFVVWDRLERRAFAARDPYGIKPLYMARLPDGWLFASQVKAVLATGLVADAPGPRGQAGFWLLGSVPEPYTWFRDIRALPAGTWCHAGADGRLDGPHAWCDVGDCWRDAPACRSTVDAAQAGVRAAVLESVRRHLVSDVPVGVFLSGGIDSGSLAGLMRDAGAADIHGVTIAFTEFAGTHQDEAPLAARIARAFGIHHHVRHVARDEFEADLPRIIAAMDQPSIDGVNTWYAGKAIAELGLKVVISGVGGDELFGGYSNFRQIPALVESWRAWSRIPGSGFAAGTIAGALARRSGNPRWRWLTRQAGSLYGAYWLRRGLFSPDRLPALMGDALPGDWPPASDPAALIEAMVGALPVDPAAAVGQMESMAYLRNQLLRDSDWACMDHSVELRTPLVDAWLLRDLAPLLRGFARLDGKRLLACSPATPLPPDIIDHRKTGFGIPLERWLAGAAGGSRVDGGGRGWAQRLAQAYGGAIA